MLNYGLVNFLIQCCDYSAFYISAKSYEKALFFPSHLSPTWQKLSRQSSQMENKLLPENIRLQPKCIYLSLKFSVGSVYVQFSSVQSLSCVRLCDPMNRSTPGSPIHHQLPGFTQTHVHQVSDAIQPSQPRSSPSSPAPNPSQHQSLFQ